MTTAYFIVQQTLKRSSSLIPLTTSKFANRLATRKTPKVRLLPFVGHRSSDFNLTLQQKMDKEQENPVDQLLARLTQQQEILTRQKQQLDENGEEDGSSSATDPYATTTLTESVETSDGRPDAAEVFRLKKELQLAQQRMAEMNIELTQSRITKHTVEEAIGSPFPSAQHLAFNMSGSGLPHQTGFHGRASPGHATSHVAAGPNALRIDTNVPTANDMFTPQQ